MTNPEWQILDLSGRWVDAPSKEAALGCIKDGTATAIALRRLASSDGGAEPVRWEWCCFEDNEQRTGWQCEGHGDQKGWEKLAESNPAKYRIVRRPLYTAPPADAGMREAYPALQRIAADCHRSKWHFDINAESPPNVYDARRLVHKAFDELQRIGNIAMHERDELSALTTPGATTKSDGVPCGLDRPSESQCPNMKEVGGGMDGERYSCAVCGKGYYLDYDDMR